MSGLASPTHLIAILLLALLLFGGKRLPEIGRDLGGGMREFRDSVNARGAAFDDEQRVVDETSASSLLD